jgi:SAM-dependent methyltransferase
MRMKVHEFKDNETYVAVQKKGSNRRANRRPAANALEIEKVCNYLATHRTPLRGVCHGARCGTEVRLFSDRFPKAKIVGTDLAPRVEEVIELDFHNTPRGWKNSFDFIYSNSLDHSNRPAECLKAWMGQLKPEGLLFLSWSRAHALEGRPLPFPGGDCFGATLSEYIELVAEAGNVRNLLYCRVRGCSIVVIVAGRK